VSVDANSLLDCCAIDHVHGVLSFQDHWPPPHKISSPLIAEFQFRDNNVSLYEFLGDDLAIVDAALGGKEFKFSLAEALKKGPVVLEFRSCRPEPIKDWSLTSLKEKLIKIGAKVVSHGRYRVSDG
jgi:hypothetical protein